MDSNTRPLTTRSCDAGDLFQQWEFVKNLPKDPSHATSGRQLGKDAQALVQIHDEDNRLVRLTDHENFVNVSNCEASLTIQDSASTMNGTDLALTIWELEKLTTQQRQAYQYVDYYEVVKTHDNGTKVLFACKAVGSEQGSPQGSSCSQ